MTNHLTRPDYTLKLTCWGKSLKAERCLRKILKEDRASDSTESVGVNVDDVEEKDVRASVLNNIETCECEWCSVAELGVLRILVQHNECPKRTREKDERQGEREEERKCVEESRREEHPNWFERDWEYHQIEFGKEYLKFNVDRQTPQVPRKHTQDIRMLHSIQRTDWLDTGGKERERKKRQRWGKGTSWEDMQIIQTNLRMKGPREREIERELTCLFNAMKRHRDTSFVRWWTCSMDQSASRQWVVLPLVSHGETKF